MLKNYFLTTLRSLRNKPTYGLLNIAGLALGIACATLIFLWVEDELNFDHAVAKRDQLFMVRLNMHYGSGITSYEGVPGPMAKAARETISTIRNAARISGRGRIVFSRQDKTIYQEGYFADSNYFDMMLLPFVKGNAAGAFRQLHSLVITEKMAKTFFGQADPIGKTLRMNNEQDYTITGVIRDFPSNYTLDFDWIAPIDNYLEKNKWLEPWVNWGITTFVELGPNTPTETVNRQLTSLIRPKEPVFTKADIVLMRLSDWHLYGNYTNGKPDGGQIKYVRLFSLIASMILLIACINFMNLATARAGQRAREVGVRKTLGALRQSLIGRYLSESLLLSFLSVLLAILLVYLSLPAFNDLVDKELTFQPLHPIHLTGLLAIGIGCGLLSGSYPAFYLSSFNPIAVLKGLKVHTRGRAGIIRKGLVITQFTLSVILIVSTVIIYQQVQHIKDRDLGYDKQNLLYLDVQGKISDRFNAIHDQLVATGLVENTALSFSRPLEMWSGTDNTQFSWAGNDLNNKVVINQEVISPGYLSTMGLQLKEGRDLYPDPNMDSTSVIINQSLATLMGKDGKVGGQLVSTHGNPPLTIVGIVRNFIFNDMYGKATPLLLYCNPSLLRYAHSLDIRLRSGASLPSAIAKIEAIIKANNPGYPVELKFADEQYQRRFDTETRIGRLAGVFAILAISISCLGLFGLAAYTAEQRTKELGIRKVLGASVPHLTSLLSREFLQLVLLSCAIAFPLAWWAMSDWLSTYTYHTAIHWWVFAIAGGCALVIALLTVSTQAVRAAMSNPINSLRSE
ncbi:ABC transporter permease [Puia dinghuensis]|uniref:ABC transporter permease n=1 Tax=Puia dinghuensis TaxID=1792502 RepID=A0A8J2UCB1_9BACT|nr:ABC transporter permease [Puia dinghuensis]GGA95763.1 ABC transporter permease [Puia dinghuensis]